MTPQAAPNPDTPTTADTPTSEVVNRAMAAAATTDTPPAPPAETHAASTTKPAKPAKPKAKPQGKTTAKKPAKPKAKAGAKATKTAKPRAAAGDGKKKDEPIKGDLKGKTLANYAAVVKAVPKLPADALNASQIAAKLSEKAKKVVWWIPTKRYLETAVERGDVVKLHRGSGKFVYHLPAVKKGKGGA
jgi:hypothetical protein